MKELRVEEVEEPFMMGLRAYSDGRDAVLAIARRSDVAGRYPR